MLLTVMVQVEDDPVYEEKREMLQNKLNELHQNFQGRLDYLYTRFQRDWLNHPKNKGTNTSQYYFMFVTVEGSIFMLWFVSCSFMVFFTYLELSHETANEYDRHVA